uniref:Uncharacterized protein n=1 Tax=Arundo donax TaxID=35708 RepID=A0A0A8YY46_ARUDO
MTYLMSYLFFYLLLRLLICIFYRLMTLQSCMVLVMSFIRTHASNT